MVCFKPGCMWMMGIMGMGGILGMGLRLMRGYIGDMKLMEYMKIIIEEVLSLPHLPSL